MEKTEYQPAPQHAGNKGAVQASSKTNVVVVVAKVLSLINVVLLAIAVATNYWVVHDTLVGTRNFGLWKQCVGSLCAPVVRTQQVTQTFTSSYQAMDAELAFVIFRGLGLGSVGLIALALLFLLLAVCKKSPRCTAVTAGVLLFFAALATGTLAAIFIIVKQVVTLRSTGYSLILACVSGGLSFIAAILSYIGACVESKQHYPGVIL